MTTSADLVLFGWRFAVERATALEAFERNAELWGSGRIEVREVPLVHSPGRTLRLMLGVHPLAVVDRDCEAAGRDAGQQDGSLPEVSNPTIEDLFPDVTIGL